ncbi:response regulator [Humidisolicoccus flavus]|uniref:response regulator n=1 Tax=Humidisolicoccus flavus TaxID=3111414 RepID=UPI00324C5DE1
MTRILIVDDQHLFCTGMQMILESQDDFEVVGFAHDGAAAIAAVGAHSPDVVLMDIRMPVLDGIEATRAIRTSAPETPPHIIVLTTIRHDHAVLSAIQVGASGFLLKDATSEFLISAIRTVVEGQQVIAPAETFDLFKAFGSSRPTPNEQAVSLLTKREREFFDHLARGRSNAEIAADMFVAETTVKSHVRAILMKLGLASRVQVIAFAYQHHLIT